jgi:hypothetical protein
MLWRALSIVLFSVSYAASADIRVTFKCDRHQTTIGGNVNEPAKPVAQYYTVYLTDSAGRYFDWRERSKINAAEPAVA